jgi:hypothetical protein
MCVVLCTVFRLIVVLFCVMCVVCMLCLVCVLCFIVVPSSPGENPFVVQINNYIYIYSGARGSIVVKTLCCKPECHGFKSR